MSDQSNTRILTPENADEEYVATVKAMTEHRPTKADKVMWKRVQAVADIAGYKFDRALAPDLTSPLSAAVWDGAVLKAGRLTPQDVLHELAHWVVSPPERKQLPNYGLGPGPFDAPGCWVSNTYVKAVTDVPTGNREEEESCIFCCYLGWLIGDDSRTMLCELNVLDMYTWDGKLSWNQPNGEKGEAAFLRAAVKQATWLKDIEPLLPKPRARKLVTPNA